jgi:P27 family predicted phage terminase small subunit
MGKMKPPAHLSSEAKKIWRDTLENYQIDLQASMVLRAGLEAMDRRDEAREALKKTGCVVRDRWGQEKMSPWVQVEKDSAHTLYQAFRLLGLDLAPRGN